MALSVTAACAAKDYQCSSDDDCAASGPPGTCEPTGYCSFLDESCPSRRRYGSHAGAGLADTCVEDAAASSSAGPETGLGSGSAGSTGAPTTAAESSGSSSTGTPADASGTTDASTGASSSGGVPQDPDLLLWLDFEDDWQMTSVVVDTSGNDRDFTCGPASCPTQIPGAAGMGALFDGTMSLLVRPTDAELQLDSAFTIVAWVRLDATPNDSFALVLGKSFSTGGLNSFEMYAHTPSATFAVNMDAGPVATALVALAPDPATWVHVAGTWDGMTLTLYRDGVAVESVPAAAPATLDDSPLTIGGDLAGPTPGAYWRGAIDEVRVYGRALDAAEVALLYGGG